MKNTLIALGLCLGLCGAARAFDLQGTSAAGLRSAWDGPEIPLSAPERVEEKGSPSCEGYPLTMRLKGRSVTLPAAGVWTLESHLATREDSFSGRSFPRTVKENISAHTANSCSLLARAVNGVNCGEVYDTRWTKEWTPPENGKAGQGSVGNLKPSKTEEMWIFNMMWLGKAMPKAGTKFLASYNGRSVVVVGGYERGPSSKKFLGGFQREVLWYLGAEEGRSQITISTLNDQSLPPGPVRCGK
jgi:hypothetical protein